MATRGNAADKQREREQQREEIENADPEDIALGMVPLMPGDLKGVFTLLKGFRKKFPAEAAALEVRVAKMLKATPEEMEAGLSVRPRNDWAKSPLSDPFGGRTFMPHDTREMAHWSQPEPRTVPPLPQAPNAKRAGRTAAKATEQIITRVQAVIKNAPEK